MLANNTSYTVILYARIIDNDTVDFYELQDSNYNSTIVSSKQSESEWELVQDQLHLASSFESVAYLAGALSTLWSRVSNASPLIPTYVTVNELISNTVTKFETYNTANDYYLRRSAVSFKTYAYSVPTPLDDTNKKAYLADFPVTIADDDDFKQVQLDLLNIIGTELYNLRFDVISSSQLNFDYSEQLEDIALSIDNLSENIESLSNNRDYPIIIKEETSEPWSVV